MLKKKISVPHTPLFADLELSVPIEFSHASGGSVSAEVSAQVGLKPHGKAGVGVGVGTANSVLCLNSISRWSTARTASSEERLPLARANVRTYLQQNWVM